MTGHADELMLSDHYLENVMVCNREIKLAIRKKGAISVGLAFSMLWTPIVLGLEKSVVIEQKQALILIALKEYNGIDCASVIKHSTDLASLAERIPTILYYYRGLCFYRNKEYRSSLGELERFFSLTPKKDSIYQSALLLHERSQNGLTATLQAAETARLLGLEEEKQRRKQSRDEERAKKKALQVEIVRSARSAIKYQYKVCRAERKLRIAERNARDPDYPLNVWDFKQKQRARRKLRRKIPKYERRLNNYEADFAEARETYDEFSERYLKKYSTDFRRVILPSSNSNCLGEKRVYSSVKKEIKSRF